MINPSDNDARLASFRTVMAMANGRPDRIPIRPFVAEFSAKVAGMTNQAITQDYEQAIEAARICVRAFDWDAVVAQHSLWLGQELGYDGIGYTGTGDFAARKKAFDEKGLKIFNLYVHSDVDKPDAYEAGLKEAIPQLKGSGVDLWLTLRGKATDDTAAVRIVREIADLAAASGVRVVLYPHLDDFVQTADEALRIVKQVDRPNVGLTINLCHELIAGNADRMDAIVKACAPHLFYVSINGADRKGTWRELIRPLDEGNFDVPAFLKSLDAVGYQGPVGLQCFQVPGAPEEHLKRSITRWKEIRSPVTGPAKH